MLTGVPLNNTRLNDVKELLRAEIRAAHAEMRADFGDLRVLNGEESFRDAGEVCGTGHPANAPGERAEDRPMTRRLAMAGPLNKKPWTNSEHPPQFSGLLGADSAFPV